jgi:hypothetical protein
MRAFYDIRDALSQSDDALLTKDNVVVVPASLRSRALHLAHEGYPGIVKMKSRSRSTIWWPGMNSDVECYVRHCAACTASGKSGRS